MRITTVRGLLLPEFDSAGESDAVLDVERRMVASGLGAMPLRAANGRVNAILTTRSIALLRDRGADLTSMTAGEAARRVVPVDVDVTLEAALESLRAQEVPRLPVVEKGREVGLLTRAEVLGYIDVEQELGPAIDNLTLTVSPNDEMFGESLWSYLAIGASALKCVRRAQAIGGKESFESILDFACGHGRVLRFFKTAFPDARLSACDINKDGVHFCARVFAAAPFFSREDPEEIKLQGKFDLIWCGSLLTHVDANRWPQFLRIFKRALAPTGLLVVTVLGTTGGESLRAGTLRGAPAEDDARERILEGYDRDGFGYADYRGEQGYGLSVCSPEWLGRVIEGQDGLHVLLHDEAAWWRLQDVVVFTPA